MTVYILIGIDPYAQPGVDAILRFDSLQNTETYLLDWVKKNLEKQLGFLSGLPGHIDNHVEKYLEYFKKNRELLFYGEYRNSHEVPYEYKWSLYLL